MEELLEHDLCKELFSNEVKCKLEDSDTLETRVQIWGTIVRRRGTIPNNVYDFSFKQTLKENQSKHYKYNIFSTHKLQ